MEEQDSGRAEWLRAVYAEAWRQYSHEDNLAHSRNTVFVSVQSALLVFIAGLATVTTASGYSSPEMTFLLWLLLLVCSVIGIAIFFAWRGATKASRSYSIVRWRVAKALEDLAGIRPFGLAQVEDLRYYPKPPRKESEEFDPLEGFATEYPEMEMHKVRARGRIRGWNSTRIIAGSFLCLWILLLVAAVAAVAGLYRAL